MVMADRPEVRTASVPITAVDVVGLAEQLANALVRVPFRHPWGGPAGTRHNLGAASPARSCGRFMGYASSLPIEEFRSVELVLDERVPAW